MTAFPAMTPEYLFKRCNLQQYMLWHDRAIEKITGEEVNRNTDSSKPEDVYDKLEYDEELKRWVAKNGN